MKNTEVIKEANKLNISEKYKSFIWMPPKTGSEHATVVATFYDFHYYISDYKRSNIFFYQEWPSHFHEAHIFEGHEEYSLICTARHPASRLFSAYRYSYSGHELTKESFIGFFKSEIEKGFGFWLRGIDDLQRIPDYFIRVENLYQDYMKVPFIKESKFATSGALEEICVKKKNENKRIGEAKDFFTDDMLDFLYRRFKWYYDLLGYSPYLNTD